MIFTRISREFSPQQLIKQARRWIIISIGVTVLLIGIALIVLPGPAIIVIPLGLAILAGELVWARRFLQKLRTLLRIPEKGTVGQESNTEEMHSGKK